jgi:hypothetical protein
METTLEWGLSPQSPIVLLGVGAWKNSNSGEYEAARNSGAIEIFCLASEETTQHLFLDCGFSQQA